MVRRITDIPFLNLSNSGVLYTRCAIRVSMHIRYLAVAWITKSSFPWIQRPQRPSSGTLHLQGHTAFFKTRRLHYPTIGAGTQWDRRSRETVSSRQVPIPTLIYGEPKRETERAKHVCPSVYDGDGKQIGQDDRYSRRLYVRPAASAAAEEWGY